MVAGYDLVADGSDNLATRLAVHDACRALGRPLVSASVQGLDGQLTTYKAHLGSPHPCLRCLFDAETGEDALPSCAQGGVLGPVAGVLGTMQAVEVVKELAGIGTLALRHDAALRRRRGQRRSDPAAAPRRLRRHVVRVALVSGRASAACKIASAAEGLRPYVKAKVRVARAGPPAVSGAHRTGAADMADGRFGRCRCATVEDAT